MNKSRLKPNNLQGVIFDIDGILLDTESFQWLGWIEVLKPYNKSISKKEYLKYAGKNGDIIEAELFNDLQLPLAKNSLLSQKEILLIEWFNAKPLQLMPFAEETATYFLKKNIKVASATGSPRDEAQLKLGKTGLLTFFQYVATRNDVKRGKPFPDVYLAAVKAIGLNPATCLAFEDTQYGVQAAKAAGLYCYAIPNKFSKNQDFSQADGIFKNLKEATAFLYHET